MSCSMCNIEKDVNNIEQDIERLNKTLKDQELQKANRIIVPKDNVCYESVEDHQYY